MATLQKLSQKNGYTRETKQTKEERGKVSTTEDVTEIEEENLPDGCMPQDLVLMGIIRLPEGWKNQKTKGILKL